MSDRRPVRPLAAGSVLTFDRAVRRPRPEVLIGGRPIRILRLTGAGSDLVHRWMGGQPVGDRPSEGALAARLVEAGMASVHSAGPTSTPSASVVVPVRDDADGLRATLASLAATVPGLKVVVVDDASTARVDAPTAEVLHNVAPCGPAGARNRGWQMTSSEIVVFVDAGCVFPQGWLEPLLQVFADPGAAAAAPRIRSRATEALPMPLAEYEEQHSALDMGPSPASVRPGAPVPYVPSTVLAVRRTALEEAGGFDEALRYGEDVDLVWRLSENGWRIRYEPSVVVTHPARPSTGAWLRQRFYYGSSAAHLTARHGAAVAPAAVSPWSTGAWALLAGGHPLLTIGTAVASSAALAWRAGPDLGTRRQLVGLAARGHVLAGAGLASAVRRAWLPPAVLVVAVARSAGGERARRWSGASSAAIAVLPGLIDWTSRKPRVGPIAWITAGVADDLAYQCGVWWGALSTRSLRALAPRWRSA